MEERIKIIFNEFPWGPCLPSYRNLYDIKITIKNYSTKRTKYFGIEYYKDYTIEIKSKICKKYSINIDEMFFYNIYNQLIDINFLALYNENYTGCDGGETIIEIIKEKGLTKYSETIELWSPNFSDENIEINKILKIIELVKEKSNYNNYIEVIENKQKIE